MPTEPSSPPADSPFDETDAEGSLRRIAEAVRSLSDAEEANVRTCLALAEAKDEHKKTTSLVSRLRHELYAQARGETRELPLFPRLKDGSAPAAPAASGPSTPGEHDPSDEAASRFALLLIPGLPSTVALQLADRGIHTLGDLAAFTNGGAKLTDIKGIGPETAEKALAALAEFWRARRGGV